MGRKIKVLITGIGAPGAPGIIRCLRANGERELFLVGVDKNQLAAGRKLVDYFHTVPDADDIHFIDELTAVAVRCGVDVILPLVTRELEVISKNVSKLTEYGIKVSVMDNAKLEIVNDKAKLLSTLKADGFVTPQFIVVNDIMELERAAYELGYPQRAICVKGAKGNGSRGIRIIDLKVSQFDLLFKEKPNTMYSTLEIVLNALREKERMPQMVVMEYLPGEEYGVDTLCENGQVIYISGRKNIAVSSSIPQGCIVEKRDEPIKYATEVVKKYMLDGNLNFDFKYNENGIPQIMEINPRLSATIIAYAPAGLNFPYLRIKQLLGERLPTIQIDEGIMMQRRYRETFFDKDGEELTW